MIYHFDYFHDLTWRFVIFPGCIPHLARHLGISGRFFA